MLKLWGSFKGGIHVVINGTFFISVLLIVAAVVLTVTGHGEAAVTSAIVGAIGAVVSFWFKPKQNGGKDDENKN